MKVNMTPKKGEWQNFPATHIKSFGAELLRKARRRSFLREGRTLNLITNLCSLKMCFTRSHHRHPAVEKFINSTEEMLSDPCFTTARWCLHQQKVSSLSNLGEISRQQLFPKKEKKKFSFSAAPETERIPLKLSSGTSLKVFLEFFSRLRSRDSWFLRREGEEWKEDKTEFLSRVKSCCLAVARECCWEEIERMRGCLGGWCCKASKLLWSFFSICRNDSLLTAICWWRGRSILIELRTKSTLWDSFDFRCTSSDLIWLNFSERLLYMQIIALGEGAARTTVNNLTSGWLIACLLEPFRCSRRQINMFAFWHGCKFA